MDDRPRYVILDLADVKEALGSHWNPAARDEYVAACPVCDEFLPQTIDECPYCGVPVVWRNSKIWRRMYGNPATVEKMLSVYPPDPDDVVGLELMRVSGTTGFANLSELARWNKGRRYLTPAHLRSIIAYCARKTHRRGVLVFALNIIDKDVRSRRTAKQRPTTPHKEINV